MKTVLTVVYIVFGGVFYAVGVIASPVIDAICAGYYAGQKGLCKYFKMEDQRDEI